MAGRVRRIRDSAARGRLVRDGLRRRPSRDPSGILRAGGGAVHVGPGPGAGHQQRRAAQHGPRRSGTGSPIPIASWEEAQLIIAEARPDEAEAAINRLRNAQGLPEYTPSGEGHIADVLEERRRQLFLEGHRHNDMLRHDLPFPTGANHMGEFRGDVTCLPLPLQERENNQNIAS